MFLDKITTIACLAVLAICGAAALATAVVSVLKKKSGTPLAVYGLLVALLLGGGYFISNNNPVPVSRHDQQADTQERHTPRYSNPNPTAETRVRPDYVAVPTGDGDEGTINIPTVGEDPAETAAEPEPEQSQEPEEVTEEPVPEKSPVRSSSTVKISTPAVRTPEAEEIPAQSYFPEPVPKPQQPSYRLDENPELSPDPTIATMSNPTPLYDPPSSRPAQEADLEAPDAAEPDNGTSDTYIHDFSNGRVLATAASDNGGDPVYHTKDCRSAVKITGNDEIWYDSAEAAQRDGRRVCKNCSR